MLLEKSPRSSTTAVYYDYNEFLPIMHEFLEDLWKTHDPMIHHEINFTDGGQVEVVIPCIEANYNGPIIKKKAIADLIDIGFNDDGVNNFDVAMNLMHPTRNPSVTLDAAVDGLIVEFSGEGRKFLEQMDKFYENVGNMNREEAAAEIARLATILRKDLKWG